METVDITALLADFGFAPRTAMASEVAERLRYKLLPSTPETEDASELFMLVFPDRSTPAGCMRWTASSWPASPPC
jgi:site-specific recombinase